MSPARRETIRALRRQRMEVLGDLELAERGRPDPTWLADRLDELKYLDRTLAKLEGTYHPETGA